MVWIFVSRVDAVADKVLAAVRYDATAAPRRHGRSRLGLFVYRIAARGSVVLRGIPRTPSARMSFGPWR